MYRRGGKLVSWYGFTILVLCSSIYFRIVMSRLAVSWHCLACCFVLWCAFLCFLVLSCVFCHPPSPPPTPPPPVWYDVKLLHEAIKITGKFPPKCVTIVTLTWLLAQAHIVQVYKCQGEEQHMWTEQTRDRKSENEKWYHRTIATRIAEQGSPLGPLQGL